jgi:hypothetical protein
MFILFGYSLKSPGQNPDIKIFGIYQSLIECKSRIEFISECACGFSQVQNLENVVYSGNYTFWYKKISLENSGDVVINVKNVPDDLN